MAPSPIEAVSFDAAGTLVHLAEPVGLTYARIAAAHGIEVDPTSVDRAFAVVWRRTPPAFSPASPVADPDERSWWRRLVREVFTEAGARFPKEESTGGASTEKPTGGAPPNGERTAEESAGFAPFFESLYDHFETPGTWKADPAASRVVEAVAARYRCAVVSNFDARVRRILADLGLLHPFEALVLSGEHGISKPDPALFRVAAQELGVAPGALLHVGDDPEDDWRAAREAGCRIFPVGPRGNRSMSELLGELSLA